MLSILRSSIFVHVRGMVFVDINRISSRAPVGAACFYETDYQVDRFHRYMMCCDYDIGYT